MDFRSEGEFVRWLRTLTSGKPARAKMGIGDDAALVRIGHNHDLILTADLSVEGVHFTARLHPPRSVGHRALARSLSDIAAMGGIPRFALISVAFARATPRVWIEEFYRGVLHLASRFRVEVIGGDTSIVRRTVMIDVTLAGEVPQGKGLLRSGARPGDEIFVSGRLGQSARGLEVLKSRARNRKRAAAGQLENPADQTAIQSHLYPTPRCDLGRWLQRSGLPSAQMDISDGLSTDLMRLCEASGVGAKVDAERVPGPAGVSPENSLELALNGGEDYELLFTVPQRKLAGLPSRYREVTICSIGRICRPREVLLIRRDGSLSPIAPAGYDHFSK